MELHCVTCAVHGLCLARGARRSPTRFHELRSLLAITAVVGTASVPFWAPLRALYLCRVTFISCTHARRAAG